MPERTAGGLRAFLAALGGIGLYLLGDRDSWWWVAAIVIATFLIGYLCLAGGRRLLREHAVAAVWLMTGWTFALLAIGAAVTALLTLAAVTVGHELAGLDKTQADVLGGAAVGALTALAGALFTKDLEDGSGSLSAAAKAEAAFHATFEKAFTAGTRQYEAVYEDRAHGKPLIQGWGLVARLRRAKAVGNS